MGRTGVLITGKLLILNCDDTSDSAYAAEPSYVKLTWASKLPIQTRLTGPSGISFPFPKLPYHREPKIQSQILPLRAS